MPLSRLGLLRLGLAGQAEHPAVGMELPALLQGGTNLWQIPGPGQTHHPAQTFLQAVSWHLGV